MFKGLFNSKKKPTPAEVQAFCDAATDADGKGALEAFLGKFGAPAIDSICPKTGYTALMRAAQHGQAGNCKFLLDRGANVNARDKHGWTPLIVALNQNRSDAFAVLLEHKADVNLANENKVTPLMTAAREGNVFFVTQLLEKGADPLLQNFAKQNAAAFARTCWTGGDEKSRARVLALLDAAIAAAEKAKVDAAVAANMKAAGQVADSLISGTDKPVNVSRPLSFKN